MNLHSDNKILFILSSFTLLTFVVVLVLYSKDAPAQPTSDLNFIIDNLNLVEKKRVSRTDYEYTYTADITNSGPDATGTTATVTSSSATTTVVEGELDFGDVATGTTATSTDTFTIRQDRRVAFDEEALGFEVEATVDLISTGSRMTVANGDISLVVPEGYIFEEEQDSPGVHNTYIWSSGGTPSSSVSEPQAELTLSIIQREEKAPGIYRSLSGFVSIGDPTDIINTETIGGKEYLVHTSYFLGVIHQIIYVTEIDEKTILRIYGLSSDHTGRDLTDVDIRNILATIEFEF